MPMYYLDLSNGISGDMLLGAFYDLSGIPKDSFESLLKSIGSTLGETTVKIRRVRRGGTRAVRIEVFHKNFSLTGSEMIAYLEECIEKVSISEGKEFAERILGDILRAEAVVHNSRIEEIKLHEIGNADTLINIVGIAYLFEELDVFKDDVYGTVLNTGKGKIEIEHGLVAVPAPVTRQLLKGLKYQAGGVEGEIATPTGVAMLRNILKGQKEAQIDAEKSGHGAGSKCSATFTGVLTVLYEY